VGHISGMAMMLSGELTDLFQRAICNSVGKAVHIIIIFIVATIPSLLTTFNDVDYSPKSQPNK
jgi:hypothetical protein